MTQYDKVILFGEKMGWILESDNTYKDSGETTDPADNDDKNPGEYPMDIWVVPNTSAERSVVEDWVVNGLDGAYYPIYNNSTTRSGKWAPDHLKIRYHVNDYPNLSCSEIDSAYNYFEQWLDSKNYTHNGCYLLINDCGRSSAYPGTSDYSAFNSRVTAYSSVRSTGSETRSIAVHEASHTFIWSGHPDVEAMIYDSEHDLGFVWPDSNWIYGGKHSPLLGNYGCVAAIDGTCNSTKCDTGEYTYGLSRCAKDAIGYTARHHL